MEIHGLNKLTLVDYDRKTACTVFTGRCNMRCPFCHNSTLVLDPKSQPIITQEEIFAYLDKRKGLLDGVCITGGEPTLQSDLADFIKKIKDKGFLVKLDTNGSNYEMLLSLIEQKLVDYVAMDIKNSPSRYAQTVGIKNFDLTGVKKSVELLLSDCVDYEFRTTVVRQLHTEQDMVEIADWIKGTKRYFLQKFVDSGSTIAKGLEACSDDEMKKFQTMLTDRGVPTFLRGVF
ncbi:MAG: anaerobic ribonucleoside-triphosphate reductase activating protein [Christensenellales bacterium]